MAAEAQPKPNGNNTSRTGGVAATRRQGTRGPRWLRPSLVVLAIGLTSTAGWSLGRRPPPPGGPVTAGLDRVLISAGHCRTSRDCFEMLPFSTEHGDPVRVRFYGVNDKNFPALLTAVGFVARQTLRQADPVGAEVEAFRESEDDYQASGLIFGRLKPLLTMTLTP